jgi:hypothetical protein
MNSMGAAGRITSRFTRWLLVRLLPPSHGRLQTVGLSSSMFGQCAAESVGVPTLLHWCMCGQGRWALS